MKAARIKCFIAMPFGRDDCDALYKLKIYPVLKSLGIEPIRVDQIEHKDDLNVFIIKKINESNIALVDLTYSRPSVYYEAGYAEREMPVIYIARADHLNRRQSDDRLRVHFDLEMKKIIPWRTYNDEYFSVRLKRRINYFIAPLKREYKKNRLLEKSRKAFMSKSVRARIDEIGHAFKTGLKRKKFWTASLWEIDKELAIKFLPGEVLVGSKMVDKTCYCCIVIVADTLTKKTIAYAVNGPLPYRVIPHSDEIKEYKIYFNLCSLQKYQSSAIASILSTAIPYEQSGEYVVEDKLSLKWQKKTTKFIRVIASIDSDLSLRESISRCLDSLPLKKTNRYAYLAKSSALLGREINEVVLSNRRLSKNQINNISKWIS